MEPINALGFMNVILLHSDHRHVSATHPGRREQKYKYNYVSKPLSTVKNRTIFG
jgi:hypothetical protein